jgi:hypothetical protein
MATHHTQWDGKSMDNVQIHKYINPHTQHNKDYGKSIINQQSSNTKHISPKRKKKDKKKKTATQ